MKRWILSVPLRNRPGQVLAVAAVSIAALLAMMSLAIDLGLLRVAHSEAQRSAEAIALAGASAFIGSSPLQYLPDAKQRSHENAGANNVRNQLLDTVIVAQGPDYWQSAEVTVTIIFDSLKVRARVERAGIGLWFAKLIGRSVATVAATAAAVAAESGGSSCVVPFAIPIDPANPMTLGQLVTLKSPNDSSIVAGVDPFYAPFSMTDDPNVPDYCPRARGDDPDQAWGRAGVCPSCISGLPTGRFPGHLQGGWHHQTPVEQWLANQSPTGSYFPGNDYAENICGNNCSPLSVGQQETILTGSMDGPTAWGVNARLAQDQDVWWDESTKQIFRGTSSTPLTNYSATPRVLTVPTFDSGQLTHPSQRQFNINGFAYFYLEAGPEHGFYDPTKQTAILGRFLFFAPGNTGGTSPFSRVLQLVE